MNITKHMQFSIVCPKCSAGVGQTCIGKRFNIVHKERQYALDNLHVTRTNLPRTKREVRANTCSVCTHGQHSRCTGRKKLGHGVIVECNCHCRIEKAKDKEYVDISL
jgi:hypothetical protein